MSTESTPTGSGADEAPAVDAPGVGGTDSGALDTGALDTHGTGAATGAATDTDTDPHTDAGAETDAHADVGEPDVAAPAVDPNRFVPVEVVNVVFTLPSPSPVLHLREVDTPFRSVDFPIGLPEAQAIALALDSEHSQRPSTSELLAAVAAAGGIDVVAVRIIGTKEGTILAELDLMTARGHQVLDCRPTDGIALALRQRVAAPILCESSLLY